MSDENVAALQSVVLRAVESAPGCIDGHVLRLNPHLWRKEDMRSVYNDRDKHAQLPWGPDWPVVKTFAGLHLGLSYEDVCVAYHGTKNTSRVMHILYEGYEPKYNRPGGFGFRSPDGAYFGVIPEVAQKYGELLLFIVPKTACAAQCAAKSLSCASSKHSSCRHIPAAIKVGLWQPVPLSCCDRV